MSGLGWRRSLRHWTSRGLTADPLSEEQRLRDRVEELEGILGVGKSDVMAYRRVLRITPDQAKILGMLAKRTETVTKTSIFTVLYGARPDCDQPGDVRIIDVEVCKLRKSLRLKGICLRTDWGAGYSMSQADKAKLRSLMEGA